MIRRHPRPAVALLGAVAFFTVFAAARGDVVRLRAYLQVVAVLFVLTLIADRVAKFSPRLVWALCSMAVIHLIGGLMTPVGNAATFYETWLIDGVLKFDQLAHGYGSAVLTVASARVVVGLLGHGVRSGVGLAVVAGLMACGLGAINELVEFLFGLDNANFHAGGLENAGWDLLFNLAGAIVGGWMVVQEPVRERVLAMAND